MEAQPPIRIGEIDESMRIDAFSGHDLVWISPRQTPALLSGFAWFERDRLYRRLPLHPAYPLAESVDALANCTAGGQLRFRTDSRKLAVKVKLAGPANMYHMPSTGQCGFDCYVGTDSGLRYQGTSRYDIARTEYEHLFFAADDSAVRTVLLNFPLYQGVEDLWIGVDRDASVCEPAPWPNRRKIVFYGTSITQGGCASRPGMCYTNIIGRQLGAECVNLGFSGSGRGEPEIARLIGEIRDVGCIVLDYEANANQLLYENLENFIRILREAHDSVPILVVSRIRYAVESFAPDKLQARLERLIFQRDLIARMNAEGDRQLFFHDGSELLGEDFDECTVDGEHPTDLGFYRMADKLGRAIADRLQASSDGSDR